MGLVDGIIIKLISKLLLVISMSVANLFDPNDLTLYCQQLNTSGVDADNNGTVLSLGTVHATEIDIGNSTNQVYINGVLFGGGGGSTGSVGPRIENGNLFFGPNVGVTGATGSCTANVGVGVGGTLRSLTTGAQNSGYGAGVLIVLTTGSGNVAYGVAGLEALIDGNYNQGFGLSALQKLVHGSSNIGIGESSLLNLQGITGTSSFNICVGGNGLYQLINGSSNLAFGYGAGGNLLNGSGNIYISNSTIGSTGETNKTYIGNINNSSGALGQSFAVMIDDNGLLAINNSLNNFLALGSGNSAITGQRNIALLNGALASVTTGSENIGMGYQSLNHLTDASFNIGLGFGTLTGLGPGSNNVGNLAIGASALAGITGGQYNIGLGLTALSRLINSSDNIGIGTSTLASLLNGIGNVSVGHQGFTGATGVSYCTGIGFEHAALLTNETHVCCLDAPGIPGVSNSIQIGTTGVHTTNYQQGIYGASVSGITVVVDGSGQLGSTVSSRSLKSDIKPIEDSYDIIKQLNPYYFTIKETNEIASGLIADEVKSIKPDWVVSLGRTDEHGNELETIKYQYLPNILLAEVKRQQSVIDNLTSKMEILESIVNKLLISK